MSLLAAGLIVAGCGEEVKCGPPSASAGEDVTGNVGEEVTLTCSARLYPYETGKCQDEAETCTYTWEQAGGPEDVTLSATDQAQVSFTPILQGLYIFKCKAIYPDAPSDDRRESQWDAVNVNVGESDCLPPVADAGGDQIQTTDLGVAITVNLDGSGSLPSPDCDYLPLSEYKWTVAEEPVGSSVTITNDESVQASVEISVIGTYAFKLKVTDVAGAFTTDTMEVQLMESAGCRGTMDVTVVDAAGNPVSGAQVSVVDSGGTSSNANTDAQGLAAFTGLADGNRQSITAVSPETVDALPGTGDVNQRPRYETTSVLDVCAASITIPLRLTASGQAARPAGTVTAKVPLSVFEMLPHSLHCAGACTSDHECNADTHFCGTVDDGPCESFCTPKMLLPFLSLAPEDEVSGQFEAAFLVPALPADSAAAINIDSVFTRQIVEGGLPGNMAVYSLFLNAVMPEVWTVDCDSSADCPDDVEWACLEHNYGIFRCKNLSPLRDVQMELPASADTPLFLVAGIVDVDMAGFSQVAASHHVLTAEVDPVALVGTFNFRTLLVCPLSVYVNAGAETDITRDLERLAPADCWVVDYQQEEVTEPLADPADIHAGNTCTTDADCQWPASGKKCMADPGTPANRYCFRPLFRVKLTSANEIELQPDMSSFDPTPVRADTRMISWLPATAQHEKLCDGGGGFNIPCFPREFCDNTVPQDTTESTFTYGLSLATLNLPQGHSAAASGGRVVIGFNFNYTPYVKNPSPKLLAPSLTLNELRNVDLSATQLFFRNVEALTNGRFETQPGRLGASVTITSDAIAPQALPAFMTIPAPDSMPDAGLETKINFVPVDPLADCASVQFTRTFAAAIEVLTPQAGTHDLPGTITESALPADVVKGMLLTRIDRVGGFTWQDPWWRIYARPGTTSIALPSGVSPFSSGDEVWLSTWGAGFTDDPFAYDLFPADILLTGQTIFSSEDFALIAP